jgi:hypothetical protein
MFVVEFAPQQLRACHAVMFITPFAFAFQFPVHIPDILTSHRHLSPANHNAPTPHYRQAWMNIHPCFVAPLGSAELTAVHRNNFLRKTEDEDVQGKTPTPTRSDAWLQRG